MDCIQVTYLRITLDIFGFYKPITISFVMRVTVESLKEELWNIRTLDLTRSTIKIVERVFWILVAISGTLWFFYFMSFQIQLWNRNSIFISKAKMKLADIDYPAITFCSTRANKHGVAERLGNYIDPSKKVDNEFLIWLRKTALDCSIDQEMHIYKEKYTKSCDDKSIPFKDRISDCKVRYFL